MTTAGISLDFNQAGKKYAMLGQRVRSLPSGGMKDQGLEHYSKLRVKAAEMLRDGEQDPNLVGEIMGCSHHFETYLNQMLNFISRIDAIDNISKGAFSPSYPVFIYTYATNKENIDPPYAVGLSTNAL